MNIYHKTNKIKPYNNSKDYQLVDVIAKIIEYVKEEAYSHIHNGHPEIALNKIKWTLTIPAIYLFPKRNYDQNQ